MLYFIFFLAAASSVPHVNEPCHISRVIVCWSDRHPLCIARFGQKARADQERCHPGIVTNTKTHTKKTIRAAEGKIDAKYVNIEGHKGRGRATLPARRPLHTQEKVLSVALKTLEADSGSDKISIDTN